MKNLKIIFNIETILNVIATLAAIILLFDAADYFSLTDSVLSYIILPISIFSMGILIIPFIFFILFCIARFALVKYYINSIERNQNSGKLKAYPMIILNVVTLIILLPFMIIGFVPYNIYVCFVTIVYILLSVFACTYAKKINSI